MDKYAGYINELSQLCHDEASKMGWWSDMKTGDRINRDQAVLIALIHSEISEALEGIRKDKMDDHIPDMKSVEVELADALIRIFDMCGCFGYNLGEAFVRKLIYNRDRADHKMENRMKKDGKKF